jgi:putative hemolysin
MILVDVLILALLFVLNGLLALSEMAVVAARKVRLETMARNHEHGAEAALDLMDDPTRFFATVQIGITLVGIIAGAFGSGTFADPLASVLRPLPVIGRYSHSIALVVVVALVTYLSLIIGELVPKRLALGQPERVAAMMARPMHILSAIAAPAVWLLRQSTEAVLRVLGRSAVRQTTVTEDEVKSLIAEGTRVGVFAPEERLMINGVLRLADRSVRAIMTPRADVAWLDREATRERIVAAVAARRHTQFLVCEGSVDAPVGLVSTRDMLAAALAGAPLDLGKLMTAVPFVPEHMPVIRLIEVFRRSRRRTAVVVDEYGVTEGIVSASDILESIAGALPKPGESADAPVVRRPDGSLLIDGMLPIDEFEELAGCHGLRGDADIETLAGLVIHRLGHLPSVGERIAIDGMTFEVVDLDDRRVDRLLVTLPPSESGGSAR